MPKLPPEAYEDFLFREYVRDLVKLGAEISDREARLLWQAWQKRVQKGESLPQTRSTLPLEVSEILLSDLIGIPDKYQLPSGRAMSRTPEQSRRIVDLALKAHWGAEQVSLTGAHPAWQVVRRFEGLMNDEEFNQYKSRKRTFQPQNLAQNIPEGRCQKCGKTYKGWALKYPEHRICKCGGKIEVTHLPQNLPQTRRKKPTRDDVEIGAWAERDRLGIWLTDKRTDKTVAEWWDEDARMMFEDGFFKPGDIRHQTITGRAFEESVLDYAESVGLIAGSGKYLPQTVRDAFYWTAVNKDTGETVESHAPYTSSSRALQGGRAFAGRHWKGQALVEVWRQPSRYSENLKIEPVASEMVTLREPAVIPHEPRKPRPGKPELEFLPDSPEFLAYTIEDIGYREKIDSAFQKAIARVRGR